jgi:hypothetical protein
MADIKDLPLDLDVALEASLIRDVNKLAKRTLDGLFTEEEYPTFFLDTLATTRGFYPNAIPTIWCSVPDKAKDLIEGKLHKTLAADYLHRILYLSEPDRSIDEKLARWRQETEQLRLWAISMIDYIKSQKMT